MKKILILLVTSITLSGCLYQSVDKVELEKGLRYCEGKGGLRNIDEWFDSDTKIECVDGTKIFERNLKLGDMGE